MGGMGDIPRCTETSWTSSFSWSTFSTVLWTPSCGSSHAARFLLTPAATKFGVRLRPVAAAPPTGVLDTEGGPRHHQIDPSMVPNQGAQEDGAAQGGVSRIERLRIASKSS
jgi:hypothetical protein